MKVELVHVEREELPENTVVDVPQYINDSLVEIGDAKATGILGGWVEYQHVFSDTEILKARFVYLYDPSMQRLGKIPLRKPEQEK